MRRSSDADPELQNLWFESGEPSTKNNVGKKTEM